MTETTNGAASGPATGGAHPTAGLVLIGDELLSGKVRDENGPFLISRLRRHGIDLREIHVVGDTVAEIAEAVDTVRTRRDHCFTSGGIGPTHDDVTMEGIAAAFGVPLEERPELVDVVATVFGAGERGAAWRKMAQVPTNCELRYLARSWPLYTVDNVYVLPGIPDIFRRQVDHLLATFDGTPVTTNVAFLDLDEGDLTRPLTELAEAYAGLVAFGSYPVLGITEYRVKVTLDSRDADALAQATAALLECLPADALHELRERVEVGEA